MNADSADPQSVPWLVFAATYGLPVVLLIVFGFIGRWTERRHFTSIRAREAATAMLPAISLKTLEAGRPVADAWLVSASVVISLDYFKRFLASLRKVFGGRLRSYETLLDRARREALLRLKEQCPTANLIANLRLETSCIAKSQGNKGVVGVEVLVYGTAVRYETHASKPATAMAG
jgi:uncharacterized protein YbjQ (UPF0145 family)